MSYIIPTLTDFKTQFPRDFPYAVDLAGNGNPGDLTKVTDDDINGAIQDAQFNVNPGLFPDQASFTRAFLYLAAHEMVDKLLMSASGIQGQYNWLRVSVGAGGVSEGFQIPDTVAENPFLASISRTRYGAKYCEIIAPLLVGNVDSVCRTTLP